MFPGFLGSRASYQFSKDLVIEVMRTEVTPDIVSKVLYNVKQKMGEGDENGGWRDGSAAKSTYCFRFQHPHGDS